LNQGRGGKRGSEALNGQDRHGKREMPRGRRGPWGREKVRPQKKGKKVILASCQAKGKQRVIFDTERERGEKNSRFSNS